MNNTCREKIEEYKNATGHEFDAARYPTPSVVPPNLLKLVATIKVLFADSRQIEIVSSIRNQPKIGDPFSLENDSEALLIEVEHLKNEQAAWTPFM
ncbi:MAG: hypothetical protein Q7K26_01485 [bacterium]|nr:hypothetical protein [bacterium]